MELALFDSPLAFVPRHQHEGLPCLPLQACNDYICLAIFSLLIRGRKDTCVGFFGRVLVSSRSSLLAALQLSANLAFVFFEPFTFGEFKAGSL